MSNTIPEQNNRPQENVQNTTQEITTKTTKKNKKQTRTEAENIKIATNTTEENNDILNHTLELLEFTNHPLPKKQKGNIRDRKSTRLNSSHRT